MKEQINKLKQIEALCKRNADAKYTEHHLFNAGKQQAYSHVFFELKKPIEDIEREFYHKKEIRILLKLIVVTGFFLLGFYTATVIQP